MRWSALRTPFVAVARFLGARGLVEGEVLKAGEEVTLPNTNSSLPSQKLTNVAPAKD